MSQWYCNIGGKQYGPVSEEELRAWVAQNRVRPVDYVWREGMENWVQSGAAPELLSPGSPVGYGAASMPGTAVAPHRGGAILALGILGICVCFICGIIAWAMANGDLREMAAGQMDRSGEETVKAGKICGIIGTILGICGLVFACLWMTVVFAALPGAMRH